jgi:asparagine synthase (glutamine-hydrolysing)
MCGICGLLVAPERRSDSNSEVLRRMNACLEHRGPDDEGYFEAPGAGLAARRLSIIDLPGGRQPIGNEDGTVWLAYNGEVYNHAELRRELEQAGHVFRTRTDTETIVHASEAWGEECVARLRGMFAFALWDGSRERLLLARDRFGIKPLYYAAEGEAFAFASEVRPILTALPGLSRRADPAALWDMLGLGFIPTPNTIFAGIRKLPAAHYLIVERRNGRPVVTGPCRYWQLDFPRAGAHRPIGEAEAAEIFVERLRDAVDVWRLSDVPVGSLLSGGVDSASLAALLQEVIGSRISTFSIGFTAATHDESALARETARFLGSDHHELTFTPADFDRLPEVVRRLEEPQCSATSVPLYLLYGACHAAGFKVILTGEGADELLGGYHWFEGDARLQPLLGLPRPARALLARLPLPASQAARRVLAEGPTDPIERYALWQQVATPGERQSLISNYPTTSFDGSPVPEHWPTEFAAPLAGRRPLDQFLYLESHTRMVDFINFEVDRMSMAHSVEARTPFLDHLLWEFAAGLPPESKLGTGSNKRLLRQGMAGRLPPQVLNQPKRGLGTPHAEWWRRERLPGWAEDALAPDALRETGYFRPGEAARLRALHQARRGDYSRVLMGVLTTQLWHDEFAR